jgi:hypothetical protein
MHCALRHLLALETNLCGRRGKMRFSSMLAAVLAIALIIISGPSALALPTAQALYTETYSEGVWRYEYTLYNEAETTAGFDIFEFFLLVDSANTLKAVNTPAGWEYRGWPAIDEPSLDNGAYFEWVSLSADTDVSPGEFLGGFSISSAFRLGDLYCEAQFWNLDGDPLSWKGQTAPVSPVPEPSSLLLLSFGLVSLALLSRFVPIPSGKR